MTQRRVPVRGGELTVHEWVGDQADSGDRPLVLLVHGITANGLSWAGVADRLARRGVRVAAPDLRGRADSRQLTEPLGLTAHVDDLMAVVDSLAPRGPVVLAGHSMGAFVAALTASRHPQRFAHVVLVDGGLSFPSPEGIDIDAALAQVIGPAMARLSMEFASPEAYVDFWRDHPAVGPLLAGPHAAQVEAYLTHDLVRGDDDAWRSSCVPDVIRADGADILADAETLAAGRAAVDAGVSMELLWAARGLMNEPQGLYDEQRLAALDLPQALCVTGLDTDHYAILFDTADAVTEAIGRGL